MNATTVLAVLTSLDPSGDDLKVRRAAIEKARSLIEANVGRFTEQHLRELMKHINTGWGRKGIVYNRFAPAFVGHNANKLVAALPTLNPLIEKLWRATTEQVPATLDLFFEEEVPSSGRSFPTAILHLRDPDRYAVWTYYLEQVLTRVLPSAKMHEDRTGAGYEEYCEAVRKFCELYKVPAQLSDKAIFLLNNSVSKDGTVEEYESTFLGFTADTFAFMTELVKNNRDDWFEENRKRFRKSVDEPLRSLVDDIGARVIHSVDAELETSSKSGRTIAKIRKNVWGKKPEGGYHELYWAAFYRKARTKQTDAQLFLTIRGRGFSHGLYLPPSADDVVVRLRAACAARATLLRTILEALDDDGFRFAGADDAHNPPSAKSVRTVEELGAILEAGALHVFKETPSDAAVSRGRELALDVGEDLRQLYPLFALATSDNVPDDIVRFLRTDRDDEDDDVVGTPIDEITLATLQDRTYLEPAFFAKLERLLSDKRQLVFSGPPGTGKTLVALEYARYLAQNGGEVSVVQFHPSYGYEDFVEGLRPAVENGQLQYRVERGVFKMLCDKARAKPKSRFVLLIDEINRGNLPRIFGELLFLLERRDQSVLLPYSKQTFSVPDNVIVLGTMNTADRSIALLDLALRRRFHFVDMEPQPEILRAWLADHERPVWIADLLIALNSELSKVGVEAGRLVGHSHFMTKGIDEEQLERIWEATIEPLVLELLFSDPGQLERFALERLRKPARQVADPVGIEVTPRAGM